MPAFPYIPTYHFSTAIYKAVIFSIAKISTLQNKSRRPLPEIQKHAANKMPAACLVRWKGFEPLTFWFVARHSIQLSYQRIFECKRYDSTVAGECQRFFDLFSIFFLVEAKRGSFPHPRRRLWKTLWLTPGRRCPLRSRRR